LGTIVNLSDDEVHCITGCLADFEPTVGSAHPCSLVDPETLGREAASLHTPYVGHST